MVNGEESKQKKPRKTNLFISKEHRDKVARQICDAFVDGALVVDACKASGITHKTFCAWRVKHKELQAMFEEAQESRTMLDRERLRYRALSALERKLEPETFTRTVREGTVSADGKMKVTKVTVFEEIHPADFRAIKEVLITFDPEFKKDEGVTHLHVTFDDELKPQKLKEGGETEQSQNES